MLAAMPRRQTRRAISVKGLTYQRVKKHCDERGQSISSFVEELIAKKMEELGIPEETVLKPRPSSSKTVVRDPNNVSQHFTF